MGNNRIICSAKFKTKFNALFWGFLLLWAGAAILGTLATERWKYEDRSYGVIESHEERKTYLGIEVEHNSYDYEESAPAGKQRTKTFDKNTGGMLAVNGIVLAAILIPVVLRAINIRIAKKAALELEESQINGHIRGLYGITNIKLNTPIDHVDNVMVSNGLLDKFRGGKTLRIGSNSGVIKFRYVQNADEFAQAAMKLIGEAKGKAPATQSAAAPAPAQTVSGGDAMEKIGSLKQMLDSGLISQEEFDAKKADILSKM